MELKPVHRVEEGPYYKANSPERKKIYGEGTLGEKLTVQGRVLDTKGNPISGAWIDFWQADGRGMYDNGGFNLRGHQYTDKDGSYSLETVMPMLYGMRTAHIHVKLQASKNSPIITTQLYFPDEPGNEQDPLFDSANVAKMESGPDGKKASFDFVLETDT